ncbi:MAG: hypothetical protein IJ697_05755 [Synergistaceae bacterium]|nr:hypothetical protein [Synergistaceae bacterium]
MKKFLALSLILFLPASVSFCSEVSEDIVFVSNDFTAESTDKIPSFSADIAPILISDDFAGALNSGSPDKKSEISQGSPRDYDSLTIGELSMLANEDSYVAAVLPKITVNSGGFYTFESIDAFANVKLSPDIPEGSPLVWHPFMRSAENSLSAAEDPNSPAEFYDKNGGVITEVPSNKTINLSAWLEAGKTYAPVIAALVKSSGENNSGGCDSVSLGALILVPLAAFLRGKHREN